MKSLLKDIEIKIVAVIAFSVAGYAIAGIFVNAVKEVVNLL